MTFSKNSVKIFLNDSHRKDKFSKNKVPNSLTSQKYVVDVVSTATENLRQSPLSKTTKSQKKLIYKKYYPSMN